MHWEKQYNPDITLSTIIEKRKNSALIKQNSETVLEWLWNWITFKLSFRSVWYNPALKERFINSSLET